MYAIMRFQKKTGGKLSCTEKHNEREKSEYKSNPDIDTSKSADNIHLKEVETSYRKAVMARTAQAGCKVRKDSVLMVETLITASPELFKSMNREEVCRFMKTAYSFLSERVGEENIVSAVIHLDEKTPHMHLCFVPLTKDNRLSAKEILGNRKRLSSYWQDGFFEHMYRQYPTLERGEPAVETGRVHIPVWLFKKGERLDKMYDKVSDILDNIGMFNAKAKSQEALTVLSEWAKEGEYFSSQVKKTEKNIRAKNDEMRCLGEELTAKDKTIRSLKASAAKKENELQRAHNDMSEIQQQLTDMGRQLRLLQLQYERYRRLYERIPKEILGEIERTNPKTKDKTGEER